MTAPADARLVLSEPELDAALESLLLATDVLELEETAELVRKRIRAIEWDGMLDENGYPHHGYSSADGSVLAGAYRGWGGEQALTVLLPGTLVADMVAILGSMFFVVGDVDK